MGTSPRRNTLRIQSRSNPTIVQLRKLAHDPLAYRAQGRLWLEGEHLCEAYVARGLKPGLAVVMEAAWEQPRWRSLAEAAVEVMIVPEVVLAGLSAHDSAPPLAFVVGLALSDRVDSHAPSIVLDRVQDAGNVGTMLRTAAAFGFTQVLALKGCAGLGAPKVLRAAMGAHFGLHLVEGLDESALDSLRVPCLAADAHAAAVLSDASLPWPCAWVFGHEGQGLGRTLAARCAGAYRIPQPGGEESLNVAAAAAVCLYESMRQRGRAAGSIQR
jgi:TrmH family RNA methyltransferase